MAIKIPNWIKKTSGYLATGAAAALAVLAATGDNAQDRLADAHQMYIGTDSVMEVSAGDTIRRPITNGDRHLKLQRWGNSTYSNGYTQFILTVETINLLNGTDSVHQIVSFTPAIGTNPVIKIFQGKSELAHEKIPGKLDALPVVALANDLGWYSAMDTVEVDSVKTTRLDKRWEADAAIAAKRIKYVAPVIAIDELGIINEKK